MNKLTLLLLFFTFAFQLSAQEFNANVVVNAEQTNVSSLQVFKTLDRDLR